MTNFIRLIVTLLFVCAVQVAHAYPTLTRKGYTSCATCHYNPSGGGALTSYGKYVAQEVYGIFNESANALPFLVMPKYEVGSFEEPLVVAQVMARAVQVLSDGKAVRAYKANRMQLDLEAGVSHDGWQALATVGPRMDSAIPSESEKTTFAFRRWWLGRVVLEYAVRAGKFMPEFGIYHPHHNIPTRRGLYFNHNEEPYIAQATKFSETFDYTLGVLKGAEKTELDGQSGVVATVAYKTGMSRYGVSHLQTKSNNSESSVAKSESATSVFAQIGHDQHYYLLSEFARKQKSQSDRRYLGYSELGWEFGKGISTYLNWEYTNLVDKKQVIHSPGIGLLVYPITHTELSLQFGRVFSRSEDYGSAQSNRAFIMANLYF